MSSYTITMICRTLEIFTLLQLKRHHFSQQSIQSREYRLLDYRWLTRHYVNSCVRIRFSFLSKHRLKEILRVVLLSLKTVLQSEIKTHFVLLLLTIIESEKCRFGWLMSFKFSRRSCLEVQLFYWWEYDYWSPILINLSDCLCYAQNKQPKWIVESDYNCWDKLR